MTPPERATTTIGPDGWIELRAGWSPAVAGGVSAVVGSTLIERWSVTAEWIAVRGAVGGLLILLTGLLVGSRSMIGIAPLPALAGAVIGFDRPVGHAWWQTLLVGLLWYLACELSWTSVESRNGTRRSPGVHRQRASEIAAVVALTVVVAGVGIVASTAAPVRTTVVKAIAVSVVLAALVVVGRRLASVAGERRGGSDEATGAGPTT